MSVDVRAPAEAVWAAAVDWERQSQWVFLTTVRPTYAGGRGVGGRIVARTGLGPLAFSDPMEITEWRPPYRCVVRHLGRVVRGAAAFEVEPLPDGGSRFTWSEWLVLPLGVLGQVGFVLLRPLIAVPLRWSLSRFARWVEAAVRAAAA